MPHLQKGEEERHPDAQREPLPEWPDGVNPHTGERGGPAGPEPTRYGDGESLRLLTTDEDSQTCRQ